MKVSALSQTDSFGPDRTLLNGAEEKRPSSEQVKSSHLATHGLIHGDLLKPFEESSKQRGLLGMTDFADFYPLWFHYEQERNIQLWSHGLSLADIEKVQFWLDPITLLDKVTAKDRLAENPLSSPSSLLGGRHTRPTDEKESYFQTLRVLLEQALPHLNALSQVGTQVLSDVYEEEQRLDLVLRIKTS